MASLREADLREKLLYYLLLPKVPIVSHQIRKGYHSSNG